jgi:hypothetical protein
MNIDNVTASSAHHGYEPHADNPNNNARQNHRSGPATWPAQGNPGDASGGSDTHAGSKAEIQQAMDWGRRRFIDESVGAAGAASKPFDDAVKHEIAADVARANQGVPSEYQTPHSELIAQSGARISQRHAGDAVAQGTIKSVVDDYLKADALISSGFNGHQPQLTGGTPGEWAGIDRIVLHETTDGFKTPDAVRADAELSENADAVVTRDGTLIQESQTGLRPASEGIAGGVGTKRENGDITRFPPAADATESEKRQHAGTNLDIELD